MKRASLRMKAVSGEKGIYRRGTKFLAKASVGGVEQYAGTHDTLAAAKRARALKVAEMLREQERGRPKRYDAETTFIMYAEEFLARRGTATNSRAFAPGTLRVIETHIHKHLVPAFGELRIGKITPSRVETLFERIAIGASPKYRRNVFQTLCLIFDDAFRKRVIPYDPTEHLPLPKVPRTRLKVPPPELVRRVIEEMTSPWKDAALLAASSGLREGEVLALEWADIDVARRCIRVTKSRDQAGGQTTPKTDESVREAIVTEDTLAALFAYRDRARAERQEANPGRRRSMRRHFRAAFAANPSAPTRHADCSRTSPRPTGTSTSSRPRSCRSRVVCGQRQRCGNARVLPQYHRRRSARRGCRCSTREISSASSIVRHRSSASSYASTICGMCGRAWSSNSAVTAR
jgi:integrase